MSSIWTVKPETVRLDGSWEGHTFWLEIKRDLTEGEAKKVSTAGFRGVRSNADPQRPAKAGDEAQGAEITIDWTAQSYVRTLTYVVDWSLSDDKGNKLALKRDTLEQLHPSAYKAIEGVINEHVEQRDREKKVPSGAKELKLKSV